MPDTGSLVRDLLTYAVRATESIRSPNGLAFLRATIAAGDSSDETLDRAREVLVRRGEQIDAMLDRARERGEPSLDSTDVVDGILAPIYLRPIFGIGGIDRDYVRGRVETVVRGAVLRERRAEGEPPRD
ncbi:TetR-like C-terminal domain-containing protein [Cellulomonas hominis]